MDFARQSRFSNIKWQCEGDGKVGDHEQPNENYLRRLQSVSFLEYGDNSVGGHKDPVKVVQDVVEEVFHRIKFCISPPPAQPALALVQPNSVDNVGEGVGHGVNNGLHKHVGDVFDAGGL